MPITKTGDWDAALKALQMAGAKMEEAVRKTLLQEAQFLRTKIVEGFREQAPGGKAWQPLSKLTLAVRQLKGMRGTKALIVRGDLRNSIAVTEVGGQVFVGVFRNARGSDGKSLINIAEIHENGAGPFLVRITAPMRKLLHAAFKKAGLEAPPGRPSTGIMVIQIPARPFIKPVIETYCTPDSKLSQRLAQRLAKNLGGQYGLLGEPPTR